MPDEIIETPIEATTEETTVALAEPSVKVIAHFNGAAINRDAPYTFSSPTAFDLNLGDNTLDMDQAQMVAHCLPDLVNAKVITFDQDVEAKAPEAPPPSALPQIIVQQPEDDKLLAAITKLTEVIAALDQSIKSQKGNKPH